MQLLCLWLEFDPLKFSFDIQKWKDEQASLRAQVRVEPLIDLPRFIVGADCAFSKSSGRVFASAVIFDRIDSKIIESVQACLACDVPYIPGYLSFREAPALLRAIRKLKHPFGAILFDGQGYAHPRRCGLAVHVGVLLDVPSVGVAKSILVGRGDEPHFKAGSYSDLIHQDEVVGEIVRTRVNVKPVYVSAGHRIDLESARKLTLACVTKYRLPEPTRIADREAARVKMELINSTFE